MLVHTGPQHQSDEATGKCVPEKSHRFLLIFFLKIPNIHEEVTGFFEPKIKWTGYCVKVKDDLGQCVIFNINISKRWNWEER